MAKKGGPRAPKGIGSNPKNRKEILHRPGLQMRLGGREGFGHKGSKSRYGGRDMVVQPNEKAPKDLKNGNVLGARIASLQVKLGN